MPQAASPTRNRSRFVVRISMPRGYSPTNKELANCAMASFAGFYSSSEVLSYYALQFPIDDAIIVERIVKEVLTETLTKLRNLLVWKDGWNGYDAVAPDPVAVSHAEDWIVELFLEVANLGLPWIQPNVVADADGNVVFEWWNDKKKLTVYIEENNAEYVQVWGLDIHSEMANGDAEPASTRRTLWLWLAN